MVVGLLAALAALPVNSCGGGGSDGKRAATAPAQAPAQSPSARTGAFASIPGLVRDVRPSVVTVLVRTPEGEGEGSGVVWDREGSIVTNHHVVASAQSVRVALASGERLAARVQAGDPRTDLAVIKVDRRDLPPAQFSSSLPQVGQLAVAIGNPLGFENTVTAGIVSGLGRAIPTGGRTPALVGLIQTDAAISPGNSGGALVGQDGKVMGINAAYIPPEARAVSIGFAIPSPLVVDVVKQLLATGRVRHAFLGVGLAELSPEIAQRFSIDTEEGAIISSVEPATPAARAGLRPGDVIVAVDRKPVTSVEDVFAALRRAQPGDRISLTVLRGGTRRTVAVTLADAPPAAG
jgi:S1-C subfamily serine protease